MLLQELLHRWNDPLRRGMKARTIWGILLVIPLLTAAFPYFEALPDPRILSYTVDPKQEQVELFWKDDAGDILNSLSRLKEYAEGSGRKLVFAMNGGMYMEDRTPLGLFIQNQQQIKRLNEATGKGNFYLMPNGVFYITTDHVPVICTTGEFKEKKDKILHATQSGPMLVIAGQLHPAFVKGSKNMHIRNGVGVLPDDRLVFAMSRTEVNFYDFASFFKDLGCTNALYLDGFVSRTYLPEQDWIQLDGNFGVMIGVTEEM